MTTKETLHRLSDVPDLPPDLVDAFRAIPPATIGHVRQSGFVDPAIRPVYPLREIVAGRAVTLQLTPGDVSHTRDAISALRPGDILVIDQGSDLRAACWGEITSLAAKMRVAAAVIIDGACTDVLEIEAMAVPTFARGISALVGRRLNLEGGVNRPVQCGGVLVRPGDLIVADINGIVVIPPAEAAALYPVAREYEDRGPHQRRWLQGGGALAEISGLTAAEIAAKVAARDGARSAGGTGER